MAVERKRNSPRKVALGVLVRAEQGRGRARELLDESIRSVALSSRDAAFAAELVYGTIRRRGTLDWILVALGTPPDRIPVRLLSILRMGLFQLCYLRVPPHAALNESVCLARSFGRKQAGFVNALLRKFQRRGGKPDFSGLSGDLLKRLTVQYSHPPGVIERWVAQFGAERAERILSVDNEPPRMWGRVNLLRITRRRLLNLLRKEGWAAVPCRVHPRLVALSGGPGLRASALFSRGLFQIQDLTALRIAEALGARPGECVADLCSAPGGKTSALAEMMNDEGVLVSVDSDAGRIDRLRGTVQRLGLSAVDIRKLDVRDAPAVFGEAFFDRVLLDVPCSNSGTFRRRVEARWEFEKRKPPRMAVLQKDLLTAASALVRPGGVLLYATCSIDPLENDGVLRSFLSGAPGFRRLEEKTFFPSRGRGDGGYYGLLQKDVP